MSRLFRIKNWEKFQHYKKRNPPWIRLYQTLLRERKLQILKDATKWHLVGLFLIASQNNNEISDDMEWLKHELCSNSPIDLKALVDSGWIEYISEDASIVLADCKQVASVVPLRDRSTETDNSETEAETEVQRTKTLNSKKRLFGQFANVLLFEAEHSKLVESFGFKGAAERIDNLSTGIASKGYRYKSHYATILSWERKNGGTAALLESFSGPDKAVDFFRIEHLSYTGAPYVTAILDSAPLASLRKGYEVEPGEFPPEWKTAVDNYFKSALGKHSLADLCNRYSVFLNSPLDGYGKPINHRNRDGGNPDSQIFR